MVGEGVIAGCEFPVPEGVFMVTELEAGARRGRHGIVRYHPLFQTV